MQIETKFDKGDTVSLENDRAVYTIHGVKFSDEKGVLYDLTKAPSDILIHSNISEDALTHSIPSTLLH